MLFVNIAGVLLIALIVWWFWFYKPTETVLDENDLVVIVKNGVYQPDHITLAPNTPAILQFLRKDESPCSETLLIPALHISESLPLNQTQRIELPAMTAGEYEFHCQMQMYRGQLTVK